MSTYPYDIDNDYKLVESLGARIGLKRLEDIMPGDDYVLHASRWWKVLEEEYPEMAYDLEIAGPDGPGNPETIRVASDSRSLVVVAPVSSGLQFRNGVLQDAPWPVGDLIYVKAALKRRVQGGFGEKVFGIFALHYDDDGNSYYSPVDQDLQPGVASNWLLDPKFDLIIDWVPIDVTDLLERLQKEHG